MFLALMVYILRKNSELPTSINAFELQQNISSLKIWIGLMYFLVFLFTLFTIVVAHNQRQTLYARSLSTLKIMPLILFNMLILVIGFGSVMYINNYLNFLSIENSSDQVSKIQRILLLTGGFQVLSLLYFSLSTSSLNENIYYDKFKTTNKQKQSLLSENQQ